MVEQLGRRAEVVLDSEAGGGGKGSPAMLTMEIGRAVVITPNRWWPKVEQRGCQTIVVEEAGAGRWVVILSLRALRAAIRNKSPPWAKFGNGSPLCVGLGDTSPLGAGLWN